MHVKNDSVAYPNASIRLSSFNNEIVSTEKVDIVVNEPSIPTPKNSNKSSE